MATGHVRSCLGLGTGVEPVCGTDRTERMHRELVRGRVWVVHDPERVRAIAEEAVDGAALVKNNPPDLINVALEELIRAGWSCRRSAARSSAISALLPPPGPPVSTKQRQRAGETAGWDFSASGCADRTMIAFTSRHVNHRLCWRQRDAPIQNDRRRSA